MSSSSHSHAHVHAVSPARVDVAVGASVLRMSLATRLSIASALLAVLWIAVFAFAQ